MNYKFIIQSPFWYYIIALAIAVGYAWLLYSKENTWGKSVNIFLAILRGMLVFAILFVLSAPLLKQSEQKIDKPILAFLIDNSSSVETHTTDLKKFITLFREETSKLNDEKEYKYYSLNGLQSHDSLEFIPFSIKKTNLQAAIKNIEDDAEGNSLAGMIIISDGNYNQGVNPSFLDYRYPVYTVGLGDTTQKTDLSLIDLKYNKIAYLGNKFQISYKLKNVGLVNDKVTVILKEKQNTLYSKDYILNKNKGEQLGNIVLDAKMEGEFHYELSCTEKEGEFTFTNNVIHIYIRVIKSKDRVLLFAQAPHPDMKAINLALSANQNYEIDEHFAGDGSKINLDNTNAAVLFGVPNKKNIGTDLYNELIKRNIPRLYIVQQNSDINKINIDAKVLNINLKSLEIDKSQAALNEQFEMFNTSLLDKDVVSQYPPLTVPFASYSIGSSEVLLYQKIGASITSNPLWVLGKKVDQKNAVILGEGLWMWRINEKSKTQAAASFDDLVTKTIQYIVSKADKKKFMVIPSAEEYEEGDLVSVSTEVYDDLNQLSYGQEITLVLKDESEKEYKYKYVNQESTDRFEVGQFPQGTYRYSAHTEVSGKSLNYSGTFIIKKLQLEEATSVANHGMLKELGMKTNGKYYEKSQMGQLAQDLNQLQSKGKVRLTETYSDLINLKWLFILLVLLISVEWFLRKYFGGY